MNPWLQISLEDYEKHMSHKNVFQLQTLNRVVGLTVKLFCPHKILVLGAAAGNGFGHFDKSTEVYAVDINNSFLNECIKRYGSNVRMLVPVNIAMNIHSLPVDDNSIDLVICHLFLEYVNFEKSAGEIYRVLKYNGIVIIVIQKNNNVEFVSDTGITSLEPFSKIANEISSEEVEKLGSDYYFIKVNEFEEALPNGKSFIIYNFKK